MNYYPSSYYYASVHPFFILIRLFKGNERIIKILEILIIIFMFFISFCLLHMHHTNH